MVTDGRDNQPGGKLPPSPPKGQADILLSPGEWELLDHELLFSPKPFVGLKRVMLRNR